MKRTTAPNGQIAHFAINADDPARAKEFYGAVFGWRFEAWGPPDFFQISCGTAGAEQTLRGALQRRRQLLADAPTRGFECTVAVADVDAVLATVRSSGGRVLMPKTVIAGVGELAFIEDTEGNVVGAMRYDDGIE